jgi:lipopolysaccharide export system protein LptA
MVQGLDDPNLSESERKESLRKAIVMRTPLYAEIEFDRDFNLGQFPLPNIKAGRLWGKVTIESDMNEIGTHDDFFLETEDISITESPGITKISTLKEVRFFAGYHYGEGSMLTMEMVLSNPNQPKSTKELSSIRFEKLKSLNLVFPETSNESQKLQNQTAKNSFTPNLSPKTRPLPDCPSTLLNIKCQREFIFQFVKADKPNVKTAVAKFFGNADAKRTNPDSSTDFLTAEEIQVKFQTKTPTSGKTNPANLSNNNNNNTLGNLEPISFEANGKLAQNNQPVVPAQLTSQQNGGVRMAGDHILYDLRQNLLVIETQTLPGASKEVEIVFQDQYFIRSEKSFQYTLGQNGEFGKLLSNGKGNLRGNIGNDKTPKKMFLSWNALQAEPYPVVKNQIILKLRDGITANLEDFGNMTAGKLDLWCNIQQSDNSKQKKNDQNNKKSPNLLPGLNSADGSMFHDGSRVMPDRAVVMDNVHFNTEKGTCNVSRLDVFFKTVEKNGTVTLSRWTPRILTENPPATNNNNQSPAIHPAATRQLINLTGNIPYQVGNLSPKDYIDDNRFNPVDSWKSEHKTEGNNNYLTKSNAGDLSVKSRLPSTNSEIIRIPSTVQKFQPIQQVQLLQPIQPNLSTIPQQTAGHVQDSGVVPLYQAQPSPPVGSQLPVLVQPNSRPAVADSVATQSLLGIQPQNSVQYAIVGKQMSMQVVYNDGRSQVETLLVEGNVRITENAAVEQLSNVNIIEITGEEITVWYPSTPETQILITGKQLDAVFRGRGIELRAKEINIARSSNKIWVPGVGRLIADTNSNVTTKYFQPQNSPTTNSAPTPHPTNSPTSLAPLKSAVPGTNVATNTVGNAQTGNNNIQNGKDNRLLVDWNESMIFNGKVLQFRGKPDRNGNRVRAIHQDKEIWCDVMEIHLNRLILFFDDKSKAKPEAEMIQCANNVFIRSREFDEHNQLKTLSSAEFGKLRFYVASNYFVAEGPSDRPGVLSFTSLGSDEGFSNANLGLPESLSSKTANNGGLLKYLSIWFHDHIQGTFLGGQRNVEISGRVQAAYLPVNSWDDHIGIDNLNIARKNGYILECEQLHIVEMPDMNNGVTGNNQNALELTALGNASIDSSKFYGKAQTIKYNQAKTLVTFDGNAKIHTFEDGKKSEQTAAETIQYDIKNKAIRMNQSQGIRIGSR